MASLAGSLWSPSDYKGSVEFNDNNRSNIADAKADQWEVEQELKIHKVECDFLIGCISDGELPEELHERGIKVYNIREVLHEKWHSLQFYINDLSR